MSIIRLRPAPLPGDDDPFAANLDAFRENWAGVFETDTAQHWQASDGTTDRVWLTPSGRWVLTSGLHGDCYITADWARAWLVRHGYPEVVAERIDVTHDGRGRPEIGPEVKFRLPEQYREALDRLATRNGLTRAEQLRAIVLDTVPLD
jgi:hypothetical protein